MCLAIPTQIKTIDDNSIATVELGGVERQISLIMTPDAKLGDYVLVHTGYAITLMDLEEAQASLEVFAELAAIQKAIEAEEAARMDDPSGAAEA